MTIKSIAIALGAIATVMVGTFVPDRAGAEDSSGRAQFMETCAACHQPDGTGIPGAFPALAGTPFVQGDAKAVVNVLINGRAGMPSFRDDLSNEQISNALTYVRSAWGNKASAISPDMVAAVRGGDQVQQVQLQAH